MAGFLRSNPQQMPNHPHHMQLALNQAKQAQIAGEVPVGAVLVDNGHNKIIATAHNSPITNNDPSGHAEMNVLRKAGQVLGNYRLENTTLYVTLEPCAMCFGAMVHARVARVVFGTTDAKTGVCGGCINLIEQPCFNHKIQIVGGIMQGECSKLLSDFFKQKRQKR